MKKGFDNIPRNKNPGVKGRKPQPFVTIIKGEIFIPQIAIKALGVQPNQEVYVAVQYMPRQNTILVYTSDPIFGRKFLWNRSGGCRISVGMMMRKDGVKVVDRLPLGFRVIRMKQVAGPILEIMLPPEELNRADKFREARMLAEGFTKKFLGTGVTV